MVLDQVAQIVGAEDMPEMAEPLVLDANVFELWRSLEFTVEGTQPLLMHNWRDNLRAPSGDGLGGKKRAQPTPEEEAPRYLYTDGAGHLALPAKMMRKSMLDAARRFPVPKKRYSAMYVVQGALQIDPEHPIFLLHDADGRPLGDHEWRVNVERVTIGNASVERGRPEVSPWFLTCRFTLDATMIAVESLEKIIITAGKQNGIGDYRPARSGHYGTFRLRHIQLT